LEAQEAATDGSGDRSEEEAEETDGSDDKELEGEPLDQAIITYVEEADDDVDHTDLGEHLQSRGAADAQIDHWLQKLLDRGDISEPEVGTYR